jgi:hypothetical protein
MSTLPRRTTRQDRRLVLIVLALATVMSVLATLTMGTVTGFVMLLLPAAALSIAAGSIAARRARVTQGRVFLGERIVLTPLIWIGLIARSLDSMGLPYGGGNSAAGISGWFLGGAWAWAGLGAGAFGVKRLYEREAALARLCRRRGARPAAPRLVLVLASLAALGVMVRLLFIPADPAMIATGALLAAAGALLVQRGFPAGMRSCRGRCLLLTGVFALAASVSTFGIISARPFVFALSSAPSERQPEIGDWLALAGSYALLGAWLLFYRPFADHEWLLARSSEKGSR